MLIFGALMYSTSLSCPGIEKNQITAGAMSYGKKLRITVPSMGSAGKTVRVVH